jgi:hypothetical protein
MENSIKFVLRNVWNVLNERRLIFTTNRRYTTNPHFMHSIDSFNPANSCS